MQNKRKATDFFGSLRWRMVSIYLLVTVLVLVAISSLVSSLMEEFLVSQRTQDQLQETARLALEVAPYMSGADVDELFTYIEDRAYSMGGRVLVLDSDAVVQMDSASRENGFLLPYREVREVLREGKDSAYGFHHILRGGDEGVFTQGDQSIWAVYYTVPLTISGHRDGAVLFSASIQDVVDSLNEVTRQITVIFVAVVIIIIIAIFLLSGWITKPIVELTSAIRRMGTQGYVRVDEKGSGEIAELGRAFNRMSERIDFFRAFTGDPAPVGAGNRKKRGLAGGGETDTAGRGKDIRGMFCDQFPSGHHASERTGGCEIPEPEHNGRLDGAL